MDRAAMSFVYGEREKQKMLNKTVIPEDEKVLRSMVKEMLNSTDDSFTDWEVEFLDNMENWNRLYTEHQANKIEAIYKERM